MHSRDHARKLRRILGLGLLGLSAGWLGAMDGPQGPGDGPRGPGGPGGTGPDPYYTPTNRGAEEVRRQQSAEAAKRFDANHDGVLDDNEKAAMVKAGFAPPEPEKDPHAGGLDRATAKPITAAEFAKAVTEAKAELTKLKEPPEGITDKQWKELRTKSVSMFFAGDTFGIYENIARTGDIGHLCGSGESAAEFTRKGSLYIGLANLQMAQTIDRAKWAPPATIMRSVVGWESVETTTLEDSTAMANVAHQKGKQFMVHPPQNMFDAWKPGDAAAAVRNIDAIRVPFNRWYAVDFDKKKTASLDKLAKLVADIRKGNPRCRIYIDVGLVDPGTDTKAKALEWAKMLAIIVDRDPKLFDGIHFAGEVRDKAKDPSVDSTRQFLAWLRMN